MGLAVVQEFHAHDKPDPIQVPWTRRQQEELKDLVEAADSSPWEIGDHVLEMVGVGEATGQKTGAYKNIRVLAHQVGCEFDALERTRRVARDWPPRFRNRGATFDAHRAYTEGGPEKAAGRAKFLERLVVQSPRGKVTAEAVRKERAKEMGATYRALTPEDRLLALCDKARNFIGPFGSEVTKHLLESGINAPWRKRNVEQIRHRADQLRYAADLLEMVTDGEELPSKDEIREQLDPKSW